MCASGSWTFDSRSEADTIAFGRRLGALLVPGDLVLLEAPFGAGKTHLTKGIATAWGVPPDEVNSPSFVLVNEYRADAVHGRAPVYHADLYRIDDPEALATVGLEETLGGDGLCIIEWAEHANGWLPDEHLLITIEVSGPNERRLELVPHGGHYAELVRRLSLAEAVA